MKCPKCEYLAFEPGDRCRHCGYDFSLAEAEGQGSRSDELPMRSDDEPGPLADFSIRNGSSGGGETSLPVRRFSRTPAVGSDLPLFQGDAPLGASPRLPRPPLAVRRSTPDPLRLRGRASRHAVEEPVLGFEPPPEPADPDEGMALDDGPDEIVTVEDPVEDGAPRPAIVGNRAGPGARLLGAAIDALLVFGVDVAVVYFTLAISGLTLAQVTMLPVTPMLGFFLVLNGGYAAAFTAVSGRTLGKMVAGTMVVRLDGGHVNFGQALLRTGGYFVSFLPVGLGFLLGLVGSRLAVHDRLAGTHVIRA